MKKAKLTVTPDLNLKGVEMLLHGLLKGELTVRETVNEFANLHEYTLRAQSHQEVQTIHELVSQSIKINHKDMQALIKATEASHE